MKMKISRKSESDLFKLGIYQLVGGIIGLLLITWVGLHSPFVTSLIITVYVIVALVFCYSIVCGILSIKLHPQALRFSLINQVAQLISIAVPAISFHYCAGFFINLGIDFTDVIRFDTQLGLSGVIFDFNTEPVEKTIHINIISLLLVIWIVRIKRKTKQEQVLQGIL